MAQAPFPTSEPVDFIIIGSGAAGGVVAKELSAAGHSVVVLEQGPHLRAADFKHDEWGYKHNNDLVWGARQGHPQTFRKTEIDTAVLVESALGYAHNVGGSSVHFSGNFWRFREVDFIEASLLGPIAGTTFSDWPITYDDLEPYYTKVDWEVGVSGLAGPWDPPRSRGYPCPPMPVKASGVLLERAAKQLGYTPYPAPVAILSQVHNGRPACIHCGFCNGFGCEVDAKSSSMAAMIPLALATDTGGGSSFSMLRTMAAAYEVGQLRGTPLHAAQLIWLATAGSARSLHLQDHIGSLAEGMEADITVLSLDSTPAIAQRHAAAKDIWESLFATIMLGDDRAIADVWVAGARRGGTA